MAPRTDHTARIPSGVASPATTRGSVIVNLRNTGNLRIGLQAAARQGHAGAALQAAKAIVDNPTLGRSPEQA